MQKLGEHYCTHRARFGKRMKTLIGELHPHICFVMQRGVKDVRRAA